MDLGLSGPGGQVAGGASVHSSATTGWSTGRPVAFWTSGSVRSRPTAVSHHRRGGRRRRLGVGQSGDLDGVGELGGHVFGERDHQVSVQGGSDAGEGVDPVAGAAAFLSREITDCVVPILSAS